MTMSREVNYCAPVSLPKSQLLESRWLPFAVAVIAVILSLPSINSGLLLDDYFHQWVLLDDSGKVSGINAISKIFSFIPGDPQIIQQAKADGHLPWWALENLKVNFFRPLAGLSHWIDYWLWPENTRLMHLHSLSLFGVAVIVSGLLYRKVMGFAAVAGLATLLFALDDAHGTAAGWIANRNTLLAGIFGMLAILFHVRGRQSQLRTNLSLALACYLMSLLSSEAGVSTIAYIFSFELFLTKKSKSNRFLVMLPYFILSLLWFGFYQLNGFGVHGTGLYYNPSDNPVGFLTVLMERFPLVLFGQWSYPPVQLFSLLPSTLSMLAYGGSIITVALLAYVIGPLLKTSAVARFWALSMLLSSIPACLTIPDTRNLFFVGIGGMGLLSLFLEAWYLKVKQLNTSTTRRLLTNYNAVVMIVVHLISAPLALPITSRGLADLVNKNAIEPLSEFIQKSPTVSTPIVFLNPPSSLFLSRTLPNGHNLPDEVFSVYSSLNNGATLSKLDEYSIAIQADNGFIHASFDRLFRSAEYPMSVGQKVVLPNCVATVITMTVDGRPLKVNFKFDDRLDSGSVRLVIWNGKQFELLSSITVGEKTRLKKGKLKF